MQDDSCKITEDQGPCLDGIVSIIHSFETGSEEDREDLHAGIQTFLNQQNKEQARSHTASEIEPSFGTPRSEILQGPEEWSRKNAPANPTQPEQIDGLEKSLRRAVWLVSESTKLPKSYRREVLYTFLRDKDAFTNFPDLKHKWRAALDAAINSGIKVTQLYKLQKGHGKIRPIVKDIHSLLGASGRYEPLYVIPEFWGALPAYDLLIVPGVGALQLFTSGERIDTALFWPPGKDLDALDAEFGDLKGLCKEILQAYPAMDKVFEEEYTHAMEQEGDLFIVKDALHTATEPIPLYKERIRPILDKGGKEAELIKTFLAARERRRKGIFEQLGGEIHFRHICSASAISRFREDGLYGKDDWAVTVGAHKVTAESAPKHIQSVIDLLAKHDNYELALVDEANESAPSNLFATWWAVKQGQGVFLVTWPLDKEGKPRKVDLIIKEPTLVRGFLKLFKDLWHSIPEDRKKKKTVYDLLPKLIV